MEIIREHFGDLLQFCNQQISMTRRDDQAGKKMEITDIVRLRYGRLSFTPAINEVYKVEIILNASIRVPVTY